MTNKTHFRKVFKSDHIGVADLEDLMESGQQLVFTISKVQQEIQTKVAGKKIDANIAYFKESIKPMVLNATNSKVLKQLTGSSFIEDWANTTIQLYIDQNASLMGQIVGGVRISPTPVKKQKAELTPDNSKLWLSAVDAYKRDGNLEAVLSRVNISPENIAKIKAESNA